MSTPAEDEPDELPGARRRSRLETLGFVFVALSVGTVFIVALFMESAGGGPNLQLVTPYAAIPGREMAVRASLFVPDHDVPGAYAPPRPPSRSRSSIARAQSSRAGSSFPLPLRGGRPSLA